MKDAARVALGVALAAALAAGTAWTSRVPVTLDEGDYAHVRLSWRVDGVTLEACRELSPEELERLPVHMRNPQACVGTKAPFELRARLGEREVMDTIRPAGARGDRPISVFRELRLPPGAVEVDVTFDALLPDTAARPADAAAHYRWNAVVELEPGEVALLTVDEDGRAVILTPGSGS